MNRSRIFQLLFALFVGILCSLCPACKQKCIVPVPTLTYTADGIIYKPADTIAGVTQIRLRVFKVTPSTLLLLDTLTPGDSRLIPNSMLVSPISVQTEYLSASGAVIARDEQIIDGGCRTYIGSMDVIIIRPEDLRELCETTPTCTLPATSATSYSFLWNTGTQPLKKILVGNAVFLVQWNASTGTAHVIPCNDLGAFTTEGQERGFCAYVSKTNSDAFTVGFAPDPNSPSGNINITINISAPTGGLPACIN